MSIRLRSYPWVTALLVITLLITSCVPIPASLAAPINAAVNSVELASSLAELGSAQTAATPTPAPTQSTSSQSGASQTNGTMGPEIEQFPSGVSPLTGMPVSDPTLLDLPAVLMSISNFPPSTRPQAGLAFAPQVFEIYISEGMTRFLTVFYGEKAEYQPRTVGDNPVRYMPFVKTGVVVGNLVWSDENNNGVQDNGEPGIGGVQVDLLDASTGKLLSTIITDSNGFYGFNSANGARVIIQFHLPEKYAFSMGGKGTDKALDSDADPFTGKTLVITVGAADDYSWDAGMIPPSYSTLGSTGATDPNHILVGDQVWLDENRDGLQTVGEHGFGGVEVNLLDSTKKVVATEITDYDGNYSFTVENGKSYYLEFVPAPGYSLSPRNVSDDTLDSDPSTLDGITELFTATENDATRWDAGLTPPYSNVIDIRSGRQAYAPVLTLYGPDSCLLAAGKSIDVRVTICQMVYNYDPLNQNAAGVATEDIPEIAKRNHDSGIDPNYSGNLFDPNAPSGGLKADELLAFWSYLNQEAFRYDPLAGAYLRYDDREADGVGELTASLDRLTGQQLMYSNVIILFVPHSLVNSSGTIIDLALTSSRGSAMVLRNGMIYKGNVVWSTIGEEYEKETGVARPIKLRYSDGTPFPLAPGNSWYLIVTPESQVWEANGPGMWKMRFSNP